MPSPPIRTLIVDDHPAMRAGIAAVLEQEDDISVVIAPAMLSHADALLSKRAGARILCRTLRDVAAAPSAVPVLPPDESERLGAMLDEDELALAALLLSRLSIDEIAEATGRTADEVDVATEQLLRRLVAGRDVSPPTSR